jgi:ATP/maltotriose-dependent transcriptional regulator MalT
MDLLEREAQRVLLDDALTHVHRYRQGKIVLLHGEAGIGKTTFVSDFTGRHHSLHPVFWGGCDSLFTPRPLGPLYDIALSGMPGLLDLLNSGADWFAISSAVLRNLLEIPDSSIVVFEDIHWADEATLDLLKYLGRRIRQTHSLFILTYRDELGGEHLLHSILGDFLSQHTLHIAMKPLSESAVELLARLAGYPAEGIYEVTKGNPFFVTEVLRNKGERIPLTVREAVLARVVHLPPIARDILELASIVPGSIETRLMERIIPPDPAALDACIQRGFLISTADSLSFRHELARQAIEASLSFGRTQELHHLILEALLDVPQADISLARLVHHASGAADAEKVIEFAPRAAQQASRHGAHHEAAEHYQNALRYASILSPQDRAKLLDCLAFEYYLTGQIAESIQLRLQAITFWRQIGRLDRVGEDFRWLSRLYWFQGKKDSADQYAEQAIATLETLPPGKELAMAYSNRSQLHMLAEENEDALVWGQKALDLAEGIQEDEIFVHALTNIGTAQRNLGDKSGREKLEMALAIARRQEMHDHIARYYANLASQSVQSREYQLAKRLLDEGLTYTIDRDMDSYSTYLRGWLARWLFEQGQWGEALKEALEVIRLKPGAAVVALPGLTVLGHLKTRQGDPESMRWLDQARDLAMPTGEFQRIGPVATARAEAAWWNGDLSLVLEEASLVYRLVQPIGDHYQLGALVYWIWRAGGEIPEDIEIPLPYRYILAGDWRKAAGEWERLGCRFEHALALMEGDVPAQQSALAIFEGLGAKPAARMAREKLLRSGVKGITRGPRPATKANPAGLTTRQMDVLVALGQGLSNAEIAHQLSVSPKTVEHHVSTILAKLGVDSRLEAVAAARQKGFL